MEWNECFTVKTVKLAPKPNYTLPYVSITVCSTVVPKKTTTLRWRGGNSFGISEHVNMLQCVLKYSVQYV